MTRLDRRRGIYAPRSLAGAELGARAQRFCGVNSAGSHPTAKMPTCTRCELAAGWPAPHVRSDSRLVKNTYFFLRVGHVPLAQAVRRGALSGARPRNRSCLGLVCKRGRPMSRLSLQGPGGRCPVYECSSVKLKFAFKRVSLCR